MTSFEDKSNSWYTPFTTGTKVAHSQLTKSTVASRHQQKLHRFYFQHYSVIQDRYSDHLWGGRPELSSQQEQDVPLHSEASTPAVGPSQALISNEYRVLFRGVKQQRREADHLPPSSAEVMNGGVTTYVFMAWC
jgi:hypothetical protein